MTREMKLGLLVGLAFMIVIGVLLSDFVQQRVQPVRADLVGTSVNVRKGVEAPGDSNPGVSPVKPPDVVIPSGQVASRESLALPEKAPQTEIVIGPAVTPAGPTVTDVSNVVVPDPSLAPLGPKPAGMIATHVVPGPPAGKTLVPPVITPGVRPESALSTKTYAAVDGDSLYTITKKAYGTWSPKAADMILKANPSMGPEGKKVKIGAKYAIPLPPTDVAKAAPTTPSVLPPTPSLAPAPAQASAVVVAKTPDNASPVKVTKPVSTKTYTVKDGDSIWKIANKQAAGHMTELVELNKDILKDGKALKIGTVLKIPTLIVASAD